MKFKDLENKRENIEGNVRFFEILDMKEKNRGCCFIVKKIDEFGDITEEEINAKNLLEETGIDIFSEVIDSDDMFWSFKKLNKYREFFVGFTRFYTLEHFYLDEEEDVKFLIVEEDKNQSFKYHRNFEGLREKKWWNFNIEKLLIEDGAYTKFRIYKKGLEEGGIKNG